MWSDCSVTCNINIYLDWGSWSAWSDCSVTCNINICLDWGPWSVWSDCSVTCNINIYLDWGSWSAWSDCSVTCNINICLDWGPWSAWSDCSVTCNNGTQTRRRDCPEEGLCEGPQEQKQECNEGKCIGNVLICWPSEEICLLRRSP